MRLLLFKPHVITLFCFIIVHQFYTIVFHANKYLVLQISYIPQINLYKQRELELFVERNMCDWAAAFSYNFM